MAKSHLSLTLSLLLSLVTDSAWSQQSAPQPAPAAMPKPDQTPAPQPPGVKQLPPKAPAPAAPTTAAPAMPTHKAPVQAPTTAVSKDPKASLQRYADGLAIVLLSLGAWEDPSASDKNRMMIALKSLKSIANEVQPLLATPSADPVMRFVSFDLSKQLLRLEAAVTAGTWQFARYLLRQITHYTIPWHPGQTKATSPLQFTEPPSSVSELEKAEYYAAIKRYDEAMISYEKYLSDKKGRASRQEIWEGAVENLMAITIRVRNDAHITLEMSSALREESSSDSTQKDMLNSWRSSAKAWTVENVGQKLNGTALLNKAQQIIEKGDQLGTKGRNFGTIEYLRAMSLINELTMSQEPDALKARGFQLAGKTSEKLKHAFVWMEADTYYEACIRSKPHSAESRECLKLLEAFQTQQKDVVPDRDKHKQLAELAQ
jgi:tetratricopeptide (TPR) repeat protein